MVKMYKLNILDVQMFTNKSNPEKYKVSNYYNIGYYYKRFLPALSGKLSFSDTELIKDRYLNSIFPHI